MAHLLNTAAWNPARTRPEIASEQAACPLFLILIAANVVLLAVGPALFANILPPFATAHTPVGPGEIGVLFFLNTFFIVVAQMPATRVVKRMRRTHAFAALIALWAIGLLAVLLATLTRSTPAVTTVLAGVALVIAIGACAQSTVLGPLVAELAPPHLLGRYMSLYSLTFTAALALGPAVGGAVLATSPDAVWWGGALTAALIEAGRPDGARSPVLVVRGVEVEIAL